MADPLRVLYLIDHLGWGGAERMLVTLAEHLDRDRVEPVVTVLGDRDGNPLVEPLRRLGVQVDRIPVRRLLDPAAVPRLVRHLRDRRPDVVHAQLEWSIVLGGIAGRIVGVPVVATLHTMDLPAPGSKARRREPVMWWALRRLHDRVVAVSEAGRDHIRSRGRVPEGKLVTLYNGIDVTAFAGGDRQEARSRLGLTGAGPVAMTVSVLRRPKGIEHMIRAIPFLAGRYPDVRYVVVGDGPDRERLEGVAEAAGVADRVLFAGVRTDVASVLPAADVFVLPTLQDTLPTVIAEAMAAGLPIVASEVGGVPEMLSGGAGRLVAPAEPVALAAAVGEVLADPQAARQMGDTARAAAEARFDVRAQVASLEAIYRTLAPPGVRDVLLIDLAKRFGGAEQRVIESARLLAESGVRCDVAVLAGSPVAAQANRRGVVCVPVGRFRFDPRIVIRLVRLLRRHGYAVVDAHNRQSQLWGVLAARLLGRGAVVTVHHDLDAVSGVRRLADVLVWRLAGFLGARFVAVTPGIAGRLTALGIPPERVDVVLGTFPELPVGAAPERSLEELVVVTVGRIDDNKGHLRLLRALERLVADGVPVRWLVVGDGPERDRLTAAGAGSPVRIEFAGHVENVAPYLAAADVFCLASRSEGLPVAALEAAAFGLPLVVPAVGGLLDLLENGSTARLVEPENESALADALAWVAGHRDEAAAMGAAARAHLARSLTPERLVEGTRDAYRAAGAEFSDRRGSGGRSAGRRPAWRRTEASSRGD